MISHTKDGHACWREPGRAHGCAGGGAAPGPCWVSRPEEQWESLLCCSHRSSFLSPSRDTDQERPGTRGMPLAHGSPSSHKDSIWETLLLKPKGRLAIKFLVTHAGLWSLGEVSESGLQSSDSREGVIGGRSLL